MDLLSFFKKRGIVYAKQYEKSVLLHQSPQEQGAIEYADTIPAVGHYIQLYSHGRYPHCLQKI